MNSRVINLLPQHLQTIYTHAESTYPEECCGLILGHLGREGKTVIEVIPTENAWNTQADEFPDEHTLQSTRRRYAIAPQVMLQAQKAARDRNWNIIGIYHSHPDNSATPSECDRRYAWAEYSYIIVSVLNGKAAKVQSWILDDHHQFQPELIENII
ncbi:MULTISPECIES: M67 family metallopeptidase [unclassified Nodularia (in: cyanobacteria)]|uniref:Mov34/MPN/PAD-1 family protein n=1 Tax=unclassified Nodularia (in: cyanobacteria) TaxID=2656917 RepID=UPI00187E1947|nr:MULTISPECIES: M67 family metallopeptidase [unclassified Nodularia (in: cyanobacteria)]MBE9199266.1 M67 family metallopeptidase [Nodularia sp. LEGE 06071]MCC2695534.1 M67 family metallopeptidase [Nodularia sp. LEGE 04288]